MCIAATSGILEGENRSQKTGTKPMQVHDVAGRDGVAVRLMGAKYWRSRWTRRGTKAEKSDMLYKSIKIFSPKKQTNL